MDRTTEIRHLSAAPRFRLCQILDEYGWKELMAAVPSNPSDLNSPPKYSVEHIHLIESHSRKTNQSFTDILIKEWGTSGKVRPTLQTLLDVLVKAELFRAADFIAIDLLKCDAPVRPNNGPAAVISFNVHELKNCTIGVNEPAPSLEIPENLPHFPFTILAQITENFSDIPFCKRLVDNVPTLSGHKLGAGAFGSVYYGVMPDGRPVAVKKLMNDAVGLLKQFQTEVSALSTYKHPNLLPLLGFSCDSVEFCIVYEFMPNSSLLDQLALSNNHESTMSGTTRTNIALGLCRGLHYLHTAKSVPLIHRDIKSANILIDNGFSPRIGDFGLVKNSSAESRMTSTVFGTSAYMAPEAFRGDVSVKMDVFSTGVVFLELLTALAPYDENRDGADIITFIQDNADDSIFCLLDASANWDIRVANELYIIALKCLEDKKKRPFIGEVLESVGYIVDNVSLA